jgi:hypothetical protein
MTGQGYRVPRPFEPNPLAFRARFLYHGLPNPTDHGHGHQTTYNP